MILDQERLNDGTSVIAGLGRERAVVAKTTFDILELDFVTGSQISNHFYLLLITCCLAHFTTLLYHLEISCQAIFQNFFPIFLKSQLATENLVHIFKVANKVPV